MTNPRIPDPADEDWAETILHAVADSTGGDHTVLRRMGIRGNATGPDDEREIPETQSRTTDNT